MTNPERFRPLHAYAVDLIDRLETDYAVTKTDAFSTLPGMHPFTHARPPVTLTPTIASAAPIAIAFTTFPSLILRYGRGLAEPFPSCGCDACDESAELEAYRLDELLDAVIRGQFSEELRIPFLGQARLSSSWRSYGSSGGRSSVIPRRHARALRAGGPRRIDWQAWPLRNDSL